MERHVFNSFNMVTSQLILETDLSFYSLMIFCLINLSQNVLQGEA